MSSPCDWSIDYACTTLPSGWVEEATDEDPKPPEQVTFESMATEYLWRWTGQQFGLCEVAVRPCRQDCYDGQSTFHGSGPGRSGGSPWRPVLLAGQWYNITCGSCGDSCGCSGRASSIRLPGPVHEVTLVVLDGTVVDPGDYWLEGNRLIRMGGEAWPTCQDISAPVTDPGTWEITYLRGLPVPAGGQIAAGVLATELFKAACGDKSCGLPQRVQSITRQGVTVAVLDAFDDIDTGHTGIWLIDSWVASVMKSPRQAVVFSPDVTPLGRIRRVPPNMLT